ncbi:RidA family protein [Herbiconiux moechotypicola]|uniref:RidA family protein n=1 Tax=Herbiconiux moechotypicola TaxID=637393 RepID=A0ABP5Q8I4_9MICO|nr:RidA family protein [Herbiconiux moechotypicola]MCS5728684.1 RidA family protein [Herbiconiux moechotypicola]
MTHRLVNPAELVKPSGFAHAVVAGRHVHLAGQTAMDASGSIVPGGIVEQFAQAFGNLLTALRAAGGAPDDLVEVTIYLTDVDDYQANGRRIGQVWRELAGAHFPAMAGIGITRLWQPEAMIEIAGVAILPEDARQVVEGVEGSGDGADEAAA